MHTDTQDLKARVNNDFNDSVIDIITDLKNVSDQGLSIEKNVNGRPKLTHYTSDKIDAICGRLHDLHDKAVIMDSLAKVGD